MRERSTGRCLSCPSSGTAAISSLTGSGSSPSPAIADTETAYGACRWGIRLTLTTPDVVYVICMAPKDMRTGASRAGVKNEFVCESDCLCDCSGEEGCSGCCCCSWWGV